VNTKDIFTLEPLLPRTPKFIVRSGDGGHTHQFPLQTLCKYMFDSGKFINPLTRKPLSPVTLKRLQRAYFYHYPKDRSLLYRCRSRRLTETSDIVAIASSLAKEKRDESERNDSMDMLEEEGLEIFQTCLANLGNPVVIHELILPDLTNIFVSMFSMHPERSVKFIKSLHIKVAQELHKPQSFDIHNVLVDLEMWLRQHAHIQQRRMRLS